ncbi:MAG: recombinase family protein [Eubacterium sp.]|nr:recombinase family protein [Eubacterium sp.]
MRIGIYNHQHMQGSCPICRQTYVQGMISDGVRCQARATAIYGDGHEFINFTDLGDYPPESLDRPGFKRMMEAVENNEIDVLVVFTLGKISNDIDLVLETYRTLKEHGVELITANDGRKAMAVLDKALAKRGM